MRLQNYAGISLFYNTLILILFSDFFFSQVEQRDVPGIDCAYLAMDTEEGVEVVWNEVQFSERKNYKAQEDKIRQVFESLTQLQHPNIVNFHRYWTDTHNDKPRVIKKIENKPPLSSPPTSIKLYNSIYYTSIFLYKYRYFSRVIIRDIIIRTIYNFGFVITG